MISQSRIDASHMTSSKPPGPINAKSPAAISSIVADFEDISLRDSLASASTGPTSPLNYFSDVSSTRSGSSRDSASSVTSALGSDTDNKKNSPAGSSSNSDDDNTAVEASRPRLNSYAMHSLKSNPSLSLMTALSSTPPTANTHNRAPLSAPARLPRQVSAPAVVSPTSNRLIRNPNNVGLGISSTSPKASPARRPASDAIHINQQRSLSTSAFNPRMSVPVLTRKNSKNSPLLRAALSANSLPRMDSNLSSSNGSFESATGRNTSNNGSFPSAPRLRRQKSFTQRISSEELEMRYEMEDNDNDDYEMDDVWMFNVPLSPALMAKNKNKGTVSSNAPKMRQPVRQMRPNKSPVTGKLPDLPRINESEAVGNCFGMEKMDEEARIINEKLKQMPDLPAPVPPKRSSRRPSPTVSGAATPKRSTSSESVTARPDGLPPKSAEEEQKHLQEYQKLLEKTAARDKKKQEKRVALQEQKASQKAADEAEWKSKYIEQTSPIASVQKNYSSFREMWWRGIPGRYRGQIWRLQIGNKLNLDSSTYNDCLSRADKTFRAEISEDVEKFTFPALHIFGKNCGPLHDDLVSILLAFTEYDTKKMGYIKGLSIFGAMLLLNLEATDAFIALANFFANDSTSSLSLALLSGDERQLAIYYDSFLRVLDTKVPQLFQHFKTIKLSPASYLQPMLTDQFSRNLSLDIMHRIWDILVFEGDAVFLRVALGVILTMEPYLYGNKNEVLELIGWNATLLEVGEEDQFMLKVREALKPASKSNS